MKDDLDASGGSGVVAGEIPVTGPAIVRVAGEAPAVVRVAGASTWLPTELAPYGTPVIVRDSQGAESIAIRDLYCLWYNEHRSSGISFTPVDWKWMHVVDAAEVEG